MLSKKKLEKLGYAPEPWTELPESSMRYREWTKKTTTGLTITIDEEEVEGRTENLFFLRIHESLPEEMKIDSATDLMLLEALFKNLVKNE